MEVEELEEVYSEEEEEEDASQDRRDWFTRQMDHELNTREKILVLLIFVRNSGRFNMITESSHVLMHAFYYGIYIGLLQYPGDFYDEPLMTRLDTLYEEWILLAKGDLEKPIVDVEQPRQSRDARNVGPQHGQKSRAFGPREHSHTKLTQSQLEGIANMLPHGYEYNRAQEIAVRWEQDAPSRLSASQALELAAYVMQWIGEELYQDLLEKAPRDRVDPLRVQTLLQLIAQRPGDRSLVYALELLQARGRVWADLQRDTASAWVPDVEPSRGNYIVVPGDPRQVDKRYGVSQFAVFIAQEKNRRELTRAVRRGLHITIDLDEVKRVKDFH